MNEIRVGVIGVGGMGTFHARTLAAQAHTVLAAVSDPSATATRALSDEFGADVVDDPYELIAGGIVDGVVIASPDATHAELTIAAVTAGLPVLCEKPLATTVADALRVIDAEVAAGRRLVQLGFMREYDPAHRQVVDALAPLGRIDAVRAVHRNMNATRRPLDVIIGQSMVHDIHSVRLLTGAEIETVHASGAGAADGSFRHIVVVATLTSGAHAVIEFDDGGFAYDVSVEVLAADGDVLTGLPTRPVRRHDGSIDVHLGADWFAWFAEAYRLQDAAWVASIHEGRATGPTTWDGVVAQIVIAAVLRSLAEGGTVAVELPERPASHR